ncbi:hypothetical protein IJG29_03060 [Candidatus Saccharibacteria bacterium]|nr:hypothetical protein [Candidatus Saccharibacteria bacterium]
MKPVDLEMIVQEIHKVGLSQWLLVELTRAFEVARKNKCGTKDEHGFELNWAENIVVLRDAVLQRHYEVSPSIVFVIFDPMVREIFAASFRDRVVHHFLYHMQGGWWDRHFIDDSYSCRVGKGVDYARTRAQTMLRRALAEARDKHTVAWVGKYDIKGYFMSLPRKRLYEKVLWGLERQFACVMDDPMGRQLYAICSYLWEKVIFDDPTMHAKKRGPKENWNPDVLPPTKSLYYQLPGYGLPIGNVTSQLASNIYMDEFDRYMKYELGYKHYGRYVDDFVVVGCDKEKMLSDVAKMEKFLIDSLELTLHVKKRYFQQASKGVEFVGAKIYARSIAPGRRMRAKFPSELEKLIAGKGNIDTVVSYLGLMRHIDAESFICKYLK